MPRNIIIVLLLVCRAATSTDAQTQPARNDGTRRPNIIVIVADDLGYADLGVQGSKEIRTPHIDALAKSGVRMTDGYVSHPFCSPTRAGLLTGRYQHRFGHERNPRYRPNDASVGLPVDQITLAEVLRKAGYATGTVGKWHLGAAPPLHPNKRGFDEFFGFLGGGHHYFCDELGVLAEQRASLPDATPENISYATLIERNGRPVETKGYLTDVLSAEAAAFVRRHTERPFFLYLTYNAPHTPLQATEKYLRRFPGIADQRRRTYAAMISAMDDGVGHLLATLNESKLDERTLVIFISDNGGQNEQSVADNTPLRGRKGQTYEGGIRIPFFVRWSGRIKPGVYREAVTSLDIFATAAALAGAALPQDRPMDSANLLPCLTGQQKGAPHQYLFWRNGGQIGVRAGRYKLVRVGREPAQLFDLQADIAESNDLAAKEPARVKSMLEAYDEWSRQTIAPIF